MSIDPILNELSFQTIAPDMYTAQKGMDSLVQTLVAASKQGANQVLRSHTHLNAIELAPNYTIAQWRNDPRVDQVMRSLLRSFSSKAPFLADMPAEEETTLTVTCYCDQDEAIGLKVAYLLDSIAISIPFTPRWDYEQITVIIRALDNDGDWLPDETVAVIHASSPTHITSLAAWMQARLSPQIASGLDLWRNRNQVYPNLEFCAVVERQLAELATGDERLAPIRRLLTSLDDYSRDWHEGRFEHTLLQGSPSPESSATLAMYGRERTFQCPDGQERVFSWHQKMYSINWRIHFYPDEERKQIIVGYIGRHLPTLTYRT